MASSIFNSIKETILGVKSNNIDHIIDKSLENISLYSSNSDNNKFIEAMKNIVSSAGLDKNNSVVSQLDKGMPRVQNYDQSGRVARYGEYDAICSKISYVQRALQVRTDHIIAPDDVLKHSIQVIPFDRDSKDRKVDIAKTRIVEFCRHFKLENKIKKLVFDTLKYGDNFVEIVPTPKGKNALVVINEGVDYTAFRKLEKLCEFTDVLKITEPVYDNNHSEIIDNKEVSNTKFKIVIDEASDGLTTKKILNEALSINMGGTLTGLTPDIYQAPFSNAVPIDTEPLSKDDHPVGKVNDDKFKSKYSNETNIDDKKEDDNLLQLKDISIVFHEPKYIIRLETQRFKVCLGYLVFPKVDPTTMLTGNMNTNIDSICANFLSTVETKLGIKTEHDKIRISDDIKNVLLAHLKKIKNNEDLKVRYVAPEFMEHFRINVSKYAPYGESILDSSLYDAKLLMALKTAATIKKINSCSDKRFVSVEVGLPRDAKNVVSKMEEMLTKKRISIGSFGNIDSIPSQISSFETIFIPMKDGKKYVEVDHQNWGGDSSNDTENIKNMRDSIIGNLGVPAPFVNIDENCLPYETEIKLLSGGSLPIGRIVELWETSERNRNIWVYSCDPDSLKIVPGRVTNVFRTRKNAKLIRIHLDNGKYVDATPDHKFMLRNGKYLEAQYLKENDSLMPLYFRNTAIKTRNNITYKEVYDPHSGSWRLVHRMVTEKTNRICKNSGLHVHHIDRNPRNNHPDNLLICTQKEHMAIHGKLINKDNHGNVLYEYDNSKLLEDRKCIICGNVFSAPIQSNIITCGNENCRKQRRINDGYKSWERKKKLHPELISKTVTCSVCGKEFTARPSSIKYAAEHSGLICCSSECRVKLVSKLTHEAAKKRNNVRPGKCVVCGKDIITSDDRRLETCSIKCTNTILARRRWKDQRTEEKCIFCGKPVQVSQYERKIMAHIHCKECGKYSTGYSRFLVKNNGSTIHDYIKVKNIPQYKNHKVVKVEWLEERKDCYDIEVEKWHNFGLTNGIIVHNSSNRSSLTTESINFLRTIIDDQKELSIPLHELICKIYRLVYGDQEADILDKIQVTFNEPKALPNSLQAEYIETMQRVIQALGELGMPKDYLKKQYLPNIDWDKVQKAAASEKLDMELNDGANNGMGMDMIPGGIPMSGGMPGAF